MAPELRRDPLSERWVIIATDRARRAGDFEAEPEAPPPAFDPFAPGNEDKTPPEIAAYRDPGSQRNKPGWRVRVVPNKFPALQIEGLLNARGEGVYDHTQGIGAHEVVIDSPRCVRSLTDLTDQNVQEVLCMYRDRLADLRKDKRLKYGIVFKNVGAAAGATLYHTHSQVIVTPIVPKAITEKIDNCKRFFDYRGRCLICDIIAQEAQQKSRVVLDTANFLSFECYAPRMPFETWIIPKKHDSHFENMQPRDAEELAQVLRGTLARIEKGLGGVAYNYMIFTAPFDCEPMGHFHWHIEITPRLTRMAGFEWGTGFYINAVPPEDAAEHLRGVRV